MSAVESTGRIALLGRPLPAMPLSRLPAEMLAVALLTGLFLLAALGNGFPIIFYDTGAYVLEGFAHVFIAERAPVYSLFLKYAGGPQSLWYVAIAQCAIVAFVAVEFARALKPALPLWTMLALGALLAIATGLPWYSGQIEPDCFAPVAPIAIYLLAFHKLGWARSLTLAALAALSTAVHFSHLAVAAGLLLVLGLLRLAAQFEGRLPRPALALPALSVAAGLALVLAANYSFTRHIFVSRAGSVFLAARMMQDGLIKPVLDQDCPNPKLRLCAYKDNLPRRADAYLWEEKISPFFRLGGFRKMDAESAFLVRESLAQAPLENLAWAGIDTALQFFAYPTGDGIEAQEWVLDPEFRRTIPKQMAVYQAAYQQRGDLWFLPLNLLHVPAAFASVALLFVMLRRRLRAGDWNGASLPAFIFVALLGNAFVCGVFSGPHFRYQSRMMWWPALAAMLIVGPRIPALRQGFESGT
ncbi:MAG: hypothetical protein JO261_15625 [Alphaproteobacteria bacterium]|nr:hypothetical protein [Alphaproteobacteria bacterium]MBV9695124.1 hypothetical protein [Alphaproteobacteria bacterium]